jgi:hypothetical protein
MNFKILDSSLAANEEFVELNVNDIAKIHCTIGIPTDPTVDFYPVMCQDLRSATTMSFHKLSKANLPAGTQAHGTAVFTVGSKDAPVSYDYRVSKLMIYTGGVYYQSAASCGFSADCASGAILSTGN